LFNFFELVQFPIIPLKEPQGTSKALRLLV